MRLFPRPWQLETRIDDMLVGRKPSRNGHSSWKDGILRDREVASCNYDSGGTLTLVLVGFPRKRLEDEGLICPNEFA